MNPTPYEKILIDAILSLRVRHCYERSFKMSNGNLRSNRFALGIPSNAFDGPAKKACDPICSVLGMPAALKKQFDASLPMASTVGFGFEEESLIPVYKAYLDFFPHAREAAMKSRDPVLIHAGFKWRADKPDSFVKTDYYLRPFLTPEEIRDRSLGYFSPEVRQAAEGFFSLLPPPPKGAYYNYLETFEEGNARHAFALVLGQSNRKLAYFSPEIVSIGRTLGLNGAVLEGLLDAAGHTGLGSIAGGTDRRGRDFFTVYHGLSYFAQRGEERLAG